MIQLGVFFMTKKMVRQVSCLGNKEEQYVLPQRKSRAPPSRNHVAHHVTRFMSGGPLFLATPPRHRAPPTGLTTPL